MRHYERGHLEFILYLKLNSRENIIDSTDKRVTNEIRHTFIPCNLDALAVKTAEACITIPIENDKM